MRTVLPILLATALGAADIVLPVPSRLELYLDGARLTHAVPVPAGRSRIPLPLPAGSLIQVDGGDAWTLENRIDGGAPPAMPPLLAELAAAKAELARMEAVLTGEEETAGRLAGELGLRLGQRGVDPGDGLATWQPAMDGLIALQSGVSGRRVRLSAAWRVLGERAAAEVAPGISYASVLGLVGDNGEADDVDPLQAVERAWSTAIERSALSRTLVVERSKPGTVIVVTERNDMRWEPHARLLAGKGRAALVRQAVVQVPAGLVLPAMPARLVGGARIQPLAGAKLERRTVTADAAPTAERRSVTTTTRAAGWAAGSASEAARDQTWELASLTLSAPTGRGCEVTAELRKDQLELTADEWVLVPDQSPVLVRRLSVRLDSQPLAAGPLELVVDGGVLGRRDMPATAPGSLIHLAAGEDQRIFLAGSTRWSEDPNRPINRKREGVEHRLRNLSGDAVEFACYLTRPVSAAKGVTIGVDPATTAGWQEVQPGILRWRLRLKAGEEMLLTHGWLIEAEGKIRL
jgi:hypothetical protein